MRLKNSVQGDAIALHTTYRNIFYLRLLAIFLIVNSHLTFFYPLPDMAFGGHLGNSIFFFISGLGLSLSQFRNFLPPLQWYRNRFLKLMIPALIFFILVNVAKPERIWHDILMNLVPHSTTQLMRFLPNLIVLYIMFPVLAKSLSFSLTLLIIVLLTPITLVVFSTDFSLKFSAFESYFYSLNAMSCFILGMLSSGYLPRLRFSLHQTFLCALLLGISTAMHLTIRFIYPDFTLLNFYINLLIVIAIFLASGFTNHLALLTPTDKYFSYLASLSLAVYITHFSILEISKSFLSPSFLSVLLIFIFSFIIASPANAFSKLIMKQLKF